MRFYIIRLNNKNHMVPVPKNASNFDLADKRPFGPTRSFKFLNKLHYCIGSAQKVHSGII